MMTYTALPATTHQMTRVNIVTGIEFETFCAALESAAPPFDRERFSRCEDWADVVNTMLTFAPHGLTVYARLDTRAMLALSRVDTPAIEYLLGNHVIAETMAHHDPNALLYAPLRVLVYADDAGNAIFAIDRPSTVFAGLGDAAIARTGDLLDDKVLGLLRALGVDARDTLAATHGVELNGTPG
jgi:hypothetical protein